MCLPPTSLLLARDPAKENWAAVLGSLGAAKLSYRFYFIGLDRLTACEMGRGPIRLSVSSLILMVGATGTRTPGLLRVRQAFGSKSRKIRTLELPTNRPCVWRVSVPACRAPSLSSAAFKSQAIGLEAGPCLTDLSRRIREAHSPVAE
jgi:hypothetical protein